MNSRQDDLLESSINILLSVINLKMVTLYVSGACTDQQDTLLNSGWRKQHDNNNNFVIYTRLIRQTSSTYGLAWLYRRVHKEMITSLDFRQVELLFARRFQIAGITPQNSAKRQARNADRKTTICWAYKPKTATGAEFLDYWAPDVPRIERILPLLTHDPQSHNDTTETSFPGFSNKTHEQEQTRESENTGTDENNSSRTFPKILFGSLAILVLTSISIALSWRTTSFLEKHINDWISSIIPVATSLLLYLIFSFSERVVARGRILANKKPKSPPASRNADKRADDSNCADAHLPDFPRLLDTDFWTKAILFRNHGVARNEQLTRTDYSFNNNLHGLLIFLILGTVMSFVIRTGEVPKGNFSDILILVGSAFLLAAIWILSSELVSLFLKKPLKRLGRAALRAATLLTLTAAIFSIPATIQFSYTGFYSAVPKQGTVFYLLAGIKPLVALLIVIPVLLLVWLIMFIDETILWHLSKLLAALFILLAVTTFIQSAISATKGMYRHDSSFGYSIEAACDFTGSTSYPVWLLGDPENGVVAPRDYLSPDHALQDGEDLSVANWHRPEGRVYLYRLANQFHKDGGGYNLGC